MTKLYPFEYEDKPKEFHYGPNNKCREDYTNEFSCPNLKFDQGWETESYRCDVCGLSFTLHYDEMK